VVNGVDVTPDWVVLTDAVRDASEMTHPGSVIRRWATRLEIDTHLVDGRLKCSPESAVVLADWLDRRLVKAA